ncbi:MAG: hypothetical protein SGJ18_07415 [Pseudomonadota bacterium]|nr:hypothetical protein [Pseudomonadota bacterium]
MRSYHAFLVIFLSFLIGVAYATTSKKNSDLAPRNKWQAYISKNLNSAFCHDGGYFRTCFPIDIKECSTTVKKLSKFCLSSMRLPDQIDMNQHGIYFGSKIGYCVGQKLELNLNHRKVNNPKCVDPRKWL